MSGSDRIVTNRRLRGLIDQYIQDCMPGTRINSHTLMRQFSNRRRCLTAQRVSMLLRDREDLKHEAANEWIVVA